MLCPVAPSDQWFLAHGRRSELALSAPKVLLRELISLLEFTALGGMMQSREVGSVVLGGVLGLSRSK